MNFNFIFIYLLVPAKKGERRMQESEDQLRISLFPVTSMYLQDHSYFPILNIRCEESQITLCRMASSTLNININRCEESAQITLPRLASSILNINC